MRPGRLLRIAGDDRDHGVRPQLPQVRDDRGEDRLVSGIAEAVVAGEQDARERPWRRKYMEEQGFRSASSRFGGVFSRGPTRRHRLPSPWVARQNENGSPREGALVSRSERASRRPVPLLGRRRGPGRDGARAAPVPELPRQPGRPVGRRARAGVGSPDRRCRHGGLRRRLRGGQSLDRRGQRRGPAPHLRGRGDAARDGVDRCDAAGVRAYPVPRAQPGEARPARRGRLRLRLRRSGGAEALRPGDPCAARRRRGRARVGKGRSAPEPFRSARRRPAGRGGSTACCLVPWRARCGSRTGTFSLCEARRRRHRPSSSADSSACCVLPRAGRRRRPPHRRSRPSGDADHPADAALVRFDRVTRCRRDGAVRGGGLQRRPGPSRRRARDRGSRRIRPRRRGPGHGAGEPRPGRSGDVPRDRHGAKARRGQPRPALAGLRRPAPRRDGGRFGAPARLGAGSANPERSSTS